MMKNDEKHDIMSRVVRNMNESFVCMCCERRHPVEKAYITNKRVGICQTCWEKIEQVPPGSPFAGTDSTRVLISPFFYTGPLRSAVLQYKFHGKWLFGEIFSRLILDYIHDFDLEMQYDAVASIPLSRKRLWERGYNQAWQIAQPVAAALELPFLDNGIFRRRHTLAQSTLRGRERYDNVRGAFIANPREIENKNIILVDDVFTYGATIESCAKELKDKGAKDILALTLAVVPRTYKK